MSLCQPIYEVAVVHNLERHSKFLSPTPQMAIGGNELKYRLMNYDQQTRYALYITIYKL